MNKVAFVVLLVAGAGGSARVALAQPPKASAQPAADRAELSYALGYEAGRDLGQHKLDIDLATVLRGVQDGYTQKNPEYPPPAMQQAIRTMQQKMVADARAAFEKLAVANLQRSRSFFADNQRKPGVITLPSGVQYKVLDAGSGDNRSPTVESEVTLQYRGEFLDGTVFDNTLDRGKPVRFPVNQMIPGWREIMLHMHVGDHWQVFIPPDQAYGFHGQPPRIGPNEALVFDIRLLGVNP